MSRLRRAAGRALRATGLRQPVVAAAPRGAPAAHPGPADPAGSAPSARPCDAPSTNMYFSATGRVAPCWIQLAEGREAWSPDRSILDIWRGPEFRRLREGLNRGEHPGACRRCADDVAQGVAPLARVYDGPENPDGYPSTLELELSNLCNLACRMCHGDLSSKIRAEREHRPPLDVPYDDSFVAQVAELFPHLRKVRFSGGEPMLHPIVHAIAQRMAEARPDLRFMVSTNGTVMTPKVRRLLEQTPVDINVSFESLRAERYEEIRVGGDHARLMANLEVYRQSAAERGGIVTINTNPMRANWDEMPDLVRYCDQRGFWLSFNTVLHPTEMALHSLPAAELAHVHETLAAAELPPAPPEHGEVADHNRRVYAELVHGQVAGWLDEARQRERAVTVHVGGSRPADA